MAKKRDGNANVPLDELIEQFERRWRQLTYDLEIKAQRREAERLRSVRSVVAGKLKSAARSIAAEWNDSTVQSDELARGLAGRWSETLANVTAAFPAMRDAPPHRIADDLAPTDKGREAYRDLLALYAQIYAKGVETAAMCAFAKWLGHRVAKDPSAQGALINLYSSGEQRTQSTPLRDTEIAAEVALARAEKGRTREAAIAEVAERLGPGAGVRNAVERRDTARKPESNAKRHAPSGSTKVEAMDAWIAAPIEHGEAP